MANLVPGDSPRTKRTPKNAREFLDALKETCNVTEACRISKLGRQTVYEWKAEDEQFKKDWKDALEIGGDTLEDEAVRRARDGVTKPVYQGKELVGHIQEYSDTLLIFLLKGAKPKKYGDKVQQEISGKDGAPIQAAISVTFVRSGDSGDQS